jgi:hypothetical protein
MNKPNLDLFDQWANETHLNDEGHWNEIKAYIDALEVRAEAAEHNFGVEHDRVQELEAAIRWAATHTLGVSELIVWCREFPEIADLAIEAGEVLIAEGEK